MQFRAVVVLLSLLFPYSGAIAELERFPSPPEPLPTEALSKLDVLATLGSLPGVTWEWHEGDTPHAENPDQNDGQWRPWADKLNGGKGALWIRARIEVPASLSGYDLADAGLILALHVSPSGTSPVILYLDGRRIAMGVDLEPEVITAKLHLGDHFTVAVKLLPTSDEKQIHPPDLTLQFPASRPDPLHFRSECLSAAVLLPTLDHDPAQLELDEKIVQRAINTVDLDALRQGKQEDFDASLRLAEKTLMPLHDKLHTLKIDAVGNSHIDAAWRWPWVDTVNAVRDTFTTALQLMPEYPNYRYTQPDVQYYAWMEKKYPALFSEMQRRARDGRWEVIGGMWGEPDLNEPDGETMTRQLLIGKRYLQEHFGKDVRIGWNVDSFGYSWQLPQVYKKSGIDFFVTQKLSWNEDNRLPLKLFWWQSPDGSSVLTYFPMSYNGSTDPVQMANEVANALPLAPGLDEVMHLYGVGDHGGGPTRVEIDRAEQWRAPDSVYPTLAMTTATEFFASVSPRVSSPAKSPIWNYKTLAAGHTELHPMAEGQIAVPVWRDELYLETHRGTFTTQARQKQNMRDAEEWMLDAEKLSSISWALGGKTYPGASLNEAWKQLLFNTNHDLAAGSGIGTIYTDAQIEYDAVHAAAKTAQDQAVAWISSRADTRVARPEEDIPLLVMNTLAWPRDGFVTAAVQLPSFGIQEAAIRDAAGNEVPFQVLSSDTTTQTHSLLLKVQHIPAMGFSVLHVTHDKSRFESDLRAEGTTLENSLTRVVIDPRTGCITHLVSKQSGFDAILDGGCGNQLQTFTDRPKHYDAWNIDKSALDTMKAIDAVDSVEIVDRGPLRASVRLRRHWGESKLIQTIVLYAGSDRVDIENDFDWHETQTLLKAAFPLRASSNTAAFEIPYGIIERPTTRDNAVEQAMYEVPALRWADLGDDKHGLSLINNSKYGYDATAHLLRISLLRSSIYPDPMADRGAQHMIYSLYPHAGNWHTAMVERRGYEFNYPLFAYQTNPHPGILGSEHCFLSVQDPSVVVTAMKHSEDGNALILRMFDWSGTMSDAAIQLPGNPFKATEADLMEHPLGQSLQLSGNQLHVQMHPYEIKTLRVEYTPADR